MLSSSIKTAAAGSNAALGASSRISTVISVLALEVASRTVTGMRSTNAVSVAPVTESLSTVVPRV
jgi:hypothetical protein